MRTKAESLLSSLTNAHSVPGHEGEVRAIFKSELEGLGTFSSDRAGSLFCEKGGEGPRIALAGHMDEIGFLIQNITYDGYLQFVNVGGWWTHTLLSQRVSIKNRNGEKILGVVGSSPPHFLSGDARKQVLDLSNLYIDIGAVSRDEVMADFGIRIGDAITPVSDFTPMHKDGIFMAKAFDNRVGMAGVIQTTQELKDETLPNQLIATATVQEEVGLRGAKTAANFIKPDCAIVLEGPPADDTYGSNPADAQGKLGNGVQIRLFDPTAITNPGLADFVQDVASASGIRHQVTVRRSGGTDAGSFHLANSGIPSIVLGTPARYIHSHNGIINIEDYLAMVELCKAILKNLDQSTFDGFVNF